MASIDLSIAIPIGGALAGAIGWLVRQGVTERKEHAAEIKAKDEAIEKVHDKVTQERIACSEALGKLQAALAEERDCRDETVAELHRQILVITELRRTDQIAAAAAIERLIARLDAMGAFRGEDVP